MTIDLSLFACTDYALDLHKARSFLQNTRELNQIIDHELAPTAEWNRATFKVTGIEEELEVVYRDPLEVIQDIYSNPAYCDSMRYQPEKHWVDAKRQCRVHNEMHTGDWWWRRQVSLRFPSISASARSHVVLVK